MFLIQIFLALAASVMAETPNCGAKVYAPRTVLSGRAYGGAKENKIDIHIPVGATKPYKTVFFIHGGCFQYGERNSKDSMQQINKMVRAGYAVVSADYRLAQPNPNEPAKAKNLYPAALDDVGDAWCWAEKNGARYGLAAGNMVAMGYSAGATLATMLGTHHRQGSSHALKCKPNVAGVIHLFGRVNFLKATEGPADEMDCGEAFAGLARNESDPQEKFRRMDILTQLPARVPPFFVSVGDSDTAVNPIENSQALCTALGNRNCDLQIIPGADHMYRGRGEWDQAFDGMCKFLAEKVFSDKTAVSAGSDQPL